MADSLFLQPFLLTIYKPTGQPATTTKKLLTSTHPAKFTTSTDHSYHHSANWLATNWIGSRCWYWDYHIQKSQPWTEACMQAFQMWEKYTRFWSQTFVNPIWKLTLGGWTDIGGRGCSLTYWCGSCVPVMYSHLKLGGERERGGERKRERGHNHKIIHYNFQYIHPHTSEKKFISRSQSLLRDRNIVFISDWGRPHFLKENEELVNTIK